MAGTDKSGSRPSSVPGLFPGAGPLTMLGHEVSNCLEGTTKDSIKAAPDGRVRITELLWSLWVLPFWLGFTLLSPHGLIYWLGAVLALVGAPLPLLLRARRNSRRAAARYEAAADSAERAKQLYETMRYRVQRLTDDLSDAGRQARIAHQMSLLGQFVAGFMHEVNNPLAILTGRTEVLLQERREDEALCRDLREILKEARYVDKIAGTLLPALKQGRSDATFEPAQPSDAIARAVAALEPTARENGTLLHFEPVEAPRVNVPSHVIEEIVRALVTNAMQALKDSPAGEIHVRIAPALAGHTSLAFEVQDNGPGIPFEMRDHLFKPFVSQASHERRSGLGLFIVDSLLSMYDGTIRLDTKCEDGARFVVEVPRARFSSEQPYHWFVSPLNTEAQEES